MDELWIPIVAIIFSVGGTLAVIVFAFYFDYRKRQSQSQEVLAAIEKGIEVPFPPPKEPRKRNYLNLGLIWSLVGIALFFAIWVSSKELAGAVWGLLPLALGIAFLLIAYFEKKGKRGEKE